jgi:hypothetical protein
MKAVLCYHPDLSTRDIPQARERTVIGVAGKLGESLLAEIRQLGGEERARGAEGALKAFQSALAELVRQNPRRYGAGDDVKSQDRVVSQLLDSVRTSFLQHMINDLRLQAGYIKVCGHWIHRAVFTFIGFGFLLAAVLPFCAVSLMSTAAWGWLPGALGLAAAVALGIWILSRIRSN